MVIKIIGLIIGIMLLGAGVSSLGKSKDDPEAKKIYTITSVIGAVIAVACAALLVL